MCVDLHNSMIDLFCDEENFWFVQWRKCLMLWYWEEEKELQHSMDNSREVLNKRQRWYYTKQISSFETLTKCLMWKWSDGK